MDTRRLSTEQILWGGILSRTAPLLDLPEIEEVLGEDSDTWKYVGDDAVAKALDDGKLVSSLNYYGIPKVWPDEGGGFRGVLLQYRAITEDRTFETAAEAAEWFGEMHHATEG